MRTKENQSGALLISVLAITLLLNLLTTLLFHSFYSLKELTQANLEQFNRLSEAATRRSGEVNLLEIPGVQQRDQTDGENHTELTYINKRVHFPSPNWDELEKLESSECLESEAWATKKYSSKQTCKNPSFVWSYTKGNLRSNDVVEFSQDTYFTQGYLRLKNLILTSSAERISIFAISDIEIGNLEINAPEVKEILIYSAKGTINIASATNKWEICNPELGEGTESKRVFLFAPLEKKFGYRFESTPGWAGCSPPLSGKLWPTRILIASDGL